MIMKTGLIAVLAFLAAPLAVAANPAKSVTTVITIEGEIAKIVPEKVEIYVRSDADGKKYEYYFNDKTVLVRGDSKAEFAELKKGQRVRVEADKRGKRLDPTRVEILD